MERETLVYQQGNLTFESSLFTKSNKPVATIILFPDWSGCREFIFEKAQYFAEQGYTAITVDLYGQGTRGSSTDPTVNQALIEPLMNERQLICERTQAALNAVKGHSSVDFEKMATLGFCFGGLCALDLARTDFPVKLAVSIHGLLMKPEGLESKDIKAKVLALHGYQDKLAPPQQLQDFVEEMEATNADWHVHIFGNAYHAFTNPEANSPEFNPDAQPPSLGVQYHKQADHQTWQIVNSYLASVFE